MALREDQHTTSSPDFQSENGALVSGFHDEDPFRVILQFLKKRAWIVLVGTALGLLCGSLINRTSKKLYTAIASLEIQAEDISSQFRLEQMQDI